MKRVVILIFLACLSLQLKAQRTTQGIGVRLGVPTGVTYKKYLAGDRAVEFGLGSAGPGWHSAYYENSIRSFRKYDGKRYLSHDVHSTLYLQGRYLVHTNIEVQGMDGKLDWYWGIGGILKFAKVRYRFEDDTPAGTYTDERTDLDFGPEGIGGMEYTFEDVPISIFAEVSLMLEFVDRVSLRPFSGTGVRYNF
ncbi:MAG: hypothetical protein ACOYXT_30175 [Bacteroidota bacterium]